ncbi:MAG: polysaccharide deacetylase family protein [Cyanothece sp. SIO1E1]|nr:polysaccharide deacetylase family protein [Cyanothece sp. SIO1E1]
MLSSKVLISLIAPTFPEAVFFRKIPKKLPRKVVALTIDDVPARDCESDLCTRPILEVIDSHNQSAKANFKATFFVITDHLPENSRIVGELAAKGHEIGNHGTTDHRHADLSPEEFEQEFLKAHELLSKSGAHPIRWFRPGQGFYNDNMISTLRTTGQELGYEDRFALASMIPFDTRAFLDDPQFTLKNVSRFTFPGSILVLHGGLKEQVSNTVEVLKALLPSLQKQGYEVVTLSKLFSE